MDFQVQLPSMLKTTFMAVWAETISLLTKRTNCCCFSIGENLQINFKTFFSYFMSKTTDYNRQSYYLLKLVVLPSTCTHTASKQILDLHKYHQIPPIVLHNKNWGQSYKLKRFDFFFNQFHNRLSPSLSALISAALTTTVCHRFWLIQPKSAKSGLYYHNAGGGREPRRELSRLCNFNKLEAEGRAEA